MRTLSGEHAATLELRRSCCTVRCCRLIRRRAAAQHLWMGPPCWRPTSASLPTSRNPVNCLSARF